MHATLREIIHVFLIQTSVCFGNLDVVKFLLTYLNAKCNEWY